MASCNESSYLMKQSPGLFPVYHRDSAHSTPKNKNRHADKRHHTTNNTQIREIDVVLEQQCV